MICNIKFLSFINCSLKTVQMFLSKISSINFKVTMSLNVVDLFLECTDNFYEKDKTLFFNRFQTSFLKIINHKVSGKQ